MRRGCGQESVPFVPVGRGPLQQQLATLEWRKTTVNTWLVHRQPWQCPTHSNQGITCDSDQVGVSELNGLEQITFATKDLGKQYLLSTYYALKFFIGAKTHT